ncbi:MAG: M48 family metallopeptidase, partial [Hydrocarboniphaga effusa]|nr:M48 family metallopeptidase [Hydrocarboniphaga effusa]
MIEIRADYFDGQTSNATQVVAALDDAQVLQIRGDNLTLAVPLTQVKVGPRLGNTVRKICLPDGCILESRDNDAIDALARLTGASRGLRLVHRLESTWRAALFAAAMLVLVLFIGVRFGIPFAAKRLAAAVPPGMAYDLGQGTLALLDRGMLKPSRLSSERQQELDRGFDDLSQAYPDLPLTLNFRRGVGPNAFALPDGSVIVTDELVELAKDDQEIYSVLMHEIGHV